MKNYSYTMYLQIKIVLPFLVFLIFTSEARSQIQMERDGSNGSVTYKTDRFPVTVANRTDFKAEGTYGYMDGYYYLMIGYVGKDRRSYFDNLSTVQVTIDGRVARTDAHMKNKGNMSVGGVNQYMYVFGIELSQADAQSILNAREVVVRFDDMNFIIGDKFYLRTILNARK